ncbi:heat shock protein [Cyclospora cayetanensis]|uniref:Heat shock protein n=1 Tax=Cyclospora cayetanensis TaxID=88456 RepID=A0A1D3D9V6_9EIME|nr:heat shock protein [Cyclospora cayetanensis]
MYGCHHRWESENEVPAQVVKPNAKKIRRLPQGVILGFAGATADCFALLEKLEQMLEQHPGTSICGWRQIDASTAFLWWRKGGGRAQYGACQLVRSCVDLAKQWRTDRYLRHLEAVLIVADEQLSLEVSGVGDVLESHDGILAVGSGGPYAAGRKKRRFQDPPYDPEN